MDFLEGILLVILASMAFWILQRPLIDYMLQLIRKYSPKRRNDPKPSFPRPYKTPHQRAARTTLVLTMLATILIFAPLVLHFSAWHYDTPKIEKTLFAVFGAYWGAVLGFLGLIVTVVYQRAYTEKDIDKEKFEFQWLLCIELTSDLSSATTLESAPENSGVYLDNARIIADIRRKTATQISLPYLLPKLIEMLDVRIEEARTLRDSQNVGYETFDPVQYATTAQQFNNILYAAKTVVANLKSEAALRLDQLGAREYVNENEISDWFK